MSDKKPSQEGEQKAKSDLKVRTTTGLIYGIVVIAGLFCSTLTTALLLIVLSYTCSSEFVRIENARGHCIDEHFIPILAAAVPFMEALPFIPPYWGAGCMVAGVFLYLMLESALKHMTTSDALRATFIVIYTSVLPVFLLYIRSNVSANLTGALLAITVQVSIWASDVFAYLIGRQIGKHKIAPKISPKKSWEGFIAGIIGSAFVWCLVPLVPGTHFSFVLAPICGIFCGVVGFFGDLYESHLKRAAGVKDSGTALPGHGGFFDRCDSLIAVTPVAWLFLVFGGVVTFI
jgi:phosphatidate cytidylyltransferase